MKKTNKANFKKIVGGVLAAVMAAAMVATAVIPAFAADDIPVAEEDRKVFLLRLRQLRKRKMCQSWLQSR